MSTGTTQDRHLAALVNMSAPTLRGPHVPVLNRCAVPREDGATGAATERTEAT